MLIDAIALLSAQKTRLSAQIETSDGSEISGSIQLDHEWDYQLGFLRDLINTEEDMRFVDRTFTSEDFRNGVLGYLSN
jgi:hypothetical protein